MCMATYPAPARAVTSRIGGSNRPADTSLTIVAPAASAAAATSAFVVSTLIATGGSTREARRRITGTTRSISTAALTGSAPGRVDSPPTSSTIAPASAGPAAGMVRCSSSADSQRPEEAHRLGPGCRVVLEDAAHRRGDGQRTGLLDPAHRHAQVLRFDDHEGAVRCELRHECVGDLGGEAFLDLRTFGVAVDETGDLGEAGDAAVVARDVRDMRSTVEGDEVVLAHRVERYVTNHDHLVVVFLEGHVEMLRRFLVQATEDLRVHVRDSIGGAREPVAVRVLADRDEDLAHCGHDPRAIDRPVHIAHELLERAATTMKATAMTATAAPRRCFKATKGTGQ